MRIPQVGETFGPYRVERLLGRGGMGAVFVANQVALSRPVALKVLLPQLADSEDYRRRFGREASALASAQSPHIVPIFDYGEIDGALFIATQLVPGGDLGMRLKNTPMEPAVALSIARDVATALADAHEVGVLHRDVKPSNVLVWDRHEGPRAYLCDFGIAKVEGTEHTSTDGIVGTWAFLSPERCNGAPASEASDIYSAGCVLWNMLTGTTPYVGTSVEMAMAHVVKPVPQLSASTEIDHQINQILSRSMAKDPSDRYQSAADMAREISRVRAQIPHAEHVAAAPGGSGMATMGGGDAGEYRTTRLSPATTEPDAEPSRHRLRNLLIGSLAIAVSVAVLTWVAVAQGWVSLDQEPGSATDDSGQNPSDTQGSEDAAATCWNGEPAVDLADCSNPEGVEGLAWVFPSIDPSDPACSVKETMVDGKETVFVCSYRFRGATGIIRYSVWDSADTAKAYYVDDYGADPRRTVTLGTAPRWMWRSGGRTDQGLFRMTSAYVGWPYSVSIEASTRPAREAAFRQVTFRPEAEMTGVREVVE